MYSLISSLTLINISLALFRSCSASLKDCLYFSVVNVSDSNVSEAAMAVMDGESTICGRFIPETNVELPGPFKDCGVFGPLAFLAPSLRLSLLPKLGF